MSCVDVSLVFGFRSALLGARVPNELVADFAAKEPGRRLAVAGIDPMADDAAVQVEIAGRLGMAGLSVSPATQGFHPSHSAAMQVYDRCCELSMPLFVTTPEPLTRHAQLEFARPSLWDEVARNYPQLPIVIGGFGHPWIEETLVLIGKHANVFADIAGVASRPWQLYNALLIASNVGVMDRLLFASAFPRELPAKAIENLYSVNAFSHGSQLPSVPRSLVRGIVERDSLSLLGIDADVIDASSTRSEQAYRDRADHTAATHSD